MPPYRGLKECPACHSHPGLYATAGDWIPAQGRNDGLRTPSRSINGVVKTKWYNTGVECAVSLAREDVYAGNLLLVAQRVCHTADAASYAFKGSPPHPWVPAPYQVRGRLLGARDDIARWPGVILVLLHFSGVLLLGSILFRYPAVFRKDGMCGKNELRRRRHTHYRLAWLGCRRKNSGRGWRLRGGRDSCPRIVVAGICPSRNSSSAWHSDPGYIPSGHHKRRNARARHSNLLPRRCTGRTTELHKACSFLLLRRASLLQRQRPKPS